MSINFSNADLLSYNHRSNFLGDNILRYKTTKEITIEGNVLNLTNTSGVSGITSGVQALELSANDWQSFIVNGVNLGSGIITNLSFSNGNDVQVKRYSISLEIYETGNLNNFAGNPPYSGIDYSNFRYITDLSETINLNRDFEQDVYDHKIDIGVLTVNKTGSLDICKRVAENLFNSANIFNVIGNYYSLSGKKQIYSEEYDEIKASASFGKQITFFANSSGNYTINKTYTYQRDKEGITNVSERADILALIEPYVDILSNAYQFESLSSFNNCLDVYNAYQNEDAYPLQNQPIVKGTTLSPFERKMDYEVTFTNNLTVNTGFFWTYQNESSLSQGGLIETTENGEIIGFGHIVSPKFVNAQAGYNSIKGQIQNRSLTAYNRFKAFNSQFTNTNLFLIKKQETFKPHNGNISYNYTYNNDQNMLVDPLLTRAQVVLREGYRVPISQLFNIPNVGEIEQVSQAFQVAEKSVEILVNGKRASTINDCLQYAKVLAHNYTGDFLTDARYSWNPYTNELSLNVSWGKIYEP